MATQCTPMNDRENDVIKTPFEDWTHNQLVEFARESQALLDDFSQWAAQLSVSHRHLVPEQFVLLQETKEISTTTTSTGD